MADAHDQTDGHAPIRIKGKLGGLISYCSGCRRVSLRYGNLLLPLSLARFEAFYTFLDETCEQHFSEPEQSELRFRFSDLYLCFDQAEAEALLELTRDAWLAICRQRLAHSYGLDSRLA